MTGPWHYAEAERLTALAADADKPEWAAEYLQLAQVHALLAQAAATADAYAADRGYNLWLEATR